MKKQYVLLFLFVLISSHLTAQDLYIRKIFDKKIEGQFKKWSAFNYEYNGKGELIGETISSWTGIVEGYVPYVAKKYNYDLNSNRVTQTTWDIFQGGYFTKDNFQFKYDENNCWVETNMNYEILYIREMDARCRLIKEEVGDYVPTIDSSWMPSRRTTVQWDTLANIGFYQFERRNSDGEMNIWKIREERYDEQNNLVFYRDERADNGDILQREIHYDDRGDIVEETLFRNIDDSVLLKQVYHSIREYKYDGNGNLIYKKNVINNPDGEMIIAATYYEYNCDDNLAFELWENNGAPTHRFFYEYENLPSCIEAENKNELSIEINPTLSNNGFFKINGPILLFENTAIFIYSSDGKLMDKKNIQDRFGYTEINLFNFPNGLYFVRITNGSFSKTLKIILAK